ncbi:putative Histidine kinase [Rubrivivax sp. A210]|uniref:PAS domain-containing hybrid sensor histidine kinase/response regulator n=1 Tax=Rubrivivax sp. A210 TaxID=2772301 RepID=UPI0019185012|nr:PAS domain-containing hybrid sensor histidine kinase/response regulator [Rubrivivax sp. A210]CAD5372654.1 putative Histidine kinase [Rubrivivax sp. A210]
MAESPIAPAPTQPHGLAMRVYLRRLIWVGMLPLVVLAVGMGAVGVAHIRQAEDEAAMRLARQVADAVEQTLRGRIDTLSVLAASPLLEGDVRLAEFHRVAQGFEYTHGSALILGDAAGRMLLHSGQPWGKALPPLPRVSGRAALPLALASGQPAVGDSFMGPVAKLRLVAVAVPLPPAAQPGGPGAPTTRALLTVVPALRLQAQFDGLRLEEGWTLTLRDGQRQVLARRPAVAASAAAAGSAVSGPSGAHFVNALSLVPWTVEVDVAAASRQAPLLGAAAMVGLGLLAAILMGLWVGGRASRRLAAAVANLAEQAPGAAVAVQPAIVEITAARALLDASASERERVAAALGVSEATFRAMFDGLSDAVVLTGADHAIRLANPAFEVLVGLGRDALIGHSAAALGLWVDLGQREALLAGMAARGTVRGVELKLRRSTGEIVDCVCAGAAFQVDGRPHHVYMLTDVSETRRQQERLRLSQDLFATAFANNPAAIALTRLQGGAVLDVNPSWLAMTGETRASIIGQSARFMWPQAEDAARFVASLQQLGKLTGWEQVFHKRNGETFEAEIAAQVLTMDGEPVILSTLVDISARKRAERELRELAATLEQRVEQRTAELAAARDEAKAANRAKSAFLANMSHEIRTPMNAVIGLTHMMARDTTDPVQADRLAKIGDAARHLLQIINDILDLSKVEAGRMVLEEVDFGLDQVLTHAFQMVSERAREKGLELVLDTDHVPPRLSGDPTRLTQLLVNLLGNAVKFTEQGWVRLRCNLQRREAGRLQVQFEVRDTGPGLSEEQRSRLFSPFEQADSSITRRHGGTGLGLALSRHLAGLMGGEIGVTSAPGEGSCFWFDAWFGLPQEAGERAAPVALAGLRALLVDDLPESLEVLGDGLRLLGLAVDALPDGMAAVQRVAAEMKAGHPYDVFLLDWRMDPPDGIATLQLLRQRLGEGMPPAVLVTAVDDPTIWEQARAAGFDAALAKPVTLSSLHDTLVRVLRAPGMPKATAAGARGDAERLLRQQHQGQRVLLAEDNPVNREVAADLLRSVGLVVETAENGRVAVEQVLARPYDLVLMDMQMPVMDGLSATREIRARAGRATPIVAMTANAFAEDRAACLAAGMNDHVAKPVDPPQLYATLRRWLPLPGDAAPALPAGGTAGGAPERPALLQRLADIKGFDCGQALRHVGGQLETLERVLARYAQTYGDGLPELRAVPDASEAARWKA